MQFAKYRKMLLFQIVNKIRRGSVFVALILPLSASAQLGAGWPSLFPGSANSGPEPRPNYEAPRFPSRGLNSAPLVSLQNMATRGGSLGGGGGAAVVCFDSKETAKKVRDQGNRVTDEFLHQVMSVEAVDLWNAKSDLGFPRKAPKFVPISNDLSLTNDEAVLEFIDRVARRFDSTVPLISQLIDRLASFRLAQFKFLDASVPQVQDLELTYEVSDKNCVVTNLAYQAVGRTNGSFEVWIDKRLYDCDQCKGRHSRLSQAFLVLHELIYSFDREWGNAKTSKNTRKFLMEILRQDQKRSVQFYANHLVRNTIAYRQWFEKTDYALFYGIDPSLIGAKPFQLVIDGIITAFELKNPGTSSHESALAYAKPYLDEIEALEYLSESQIMILKGKITRAIELFYDEMGNPLPADKAFKNIRENSTSLTFYSSNFSSVEKMVVPEIK